jgi:hypothetical protein
MPDFSPLPFNRRLGFHYFPDTRHYRQQDLETWLPELRRLGAAWVTLLAPAGRAIPEPFLSGLVNAGIQPVLHFIIPLTQPSRSTDWSLLFSQYVRWGVRYLAFFDRPNLATSWTAAAWAHGDLVERFLDSFLPLAEAALAQGVVPVFPPLEPGGDYWDLAFLRLALRGLQRRASSGLLDELALAVYAWVGDRPLDWGAGGPQRWPEARPYATPAGIQDQRGFRIFDWYQAIVEQETGRRLPLIALRAGQVLSATASPVDRQGHARANLAAAHLLTIQDGVAGPGASQLASGASSALCEPGIVTQNSATADQGTSAETGYLAGGSPEEPAGEPLPPEVLACNFWLLAAAPGSPHAAHAWFPSQGEPLPVVHAFAQWTAYYRRLSRPAEPVVLHRLTENLWRDQPNSQPTPIPPSDQAEGTGSTIAHYVLLPLYAWGASSWDLAHIQPLLDETHPTVGFSLAEARLARRVTVVAGAGAISDPALEMLRQSGCQVERLLEDGTLVAT